MRSRPRVSGNSRRQGGLRRWRLVSGTGAERNDVFDDQIDVRLCCCFPTSSAYVNHFIFRCREDISQRSIPPSTLVVAGRKHPAMPGAISAIWIRDILQRHRWRFFRQIQQDRLNRGQPISAGVSKRSTRSCSARARLQTPTSTVQLISPGRLSLRGRDGRSSSNSLFLLLPSSIIFALPQTTAQV